MKTRIEGRIWVFGDHISTDHIIPGRYFHLRGDLTALAEHALEDGNPDFAAQARPGDIVVAGKNFGQGSSREHAALVLRERGVPAVLAPYFARIFFRNAVNVGLPPVQCATEGFVSGDQVTIDLQEGWVENHTQGFRREFQPLPGVMRQILAAGGLVPFVREHGSLDVGG